MSRSLPPPPMALRWVALGVISLAGFGSSYLFDCIGPLAKLLSDQLRFSDADIGLLQAVCSVPNLFMVLLGGIVVDEIGVRRAGLIFALLCCAGAVLTALSPSLPVMMAGRLVYGIGSGSLSVAVSTGIAKWFIGEKQGFVFGVNLTLSRLGSLAAQVSPAWARGAYVSWRTPLLIAVAFGGVCVLGAAAYWILEVRASRRYAIGAPGQDRPARSRGLDFGKSYWLVSLVCVTFYAGIYPFLTFAQKFFVEARGATLGQASLFVGMLTVMAMVLTPLAGLLADRVGRRTLLLGIGTVLLVPAYLLMAYTRLSLAIPMALMGLAFSLVPAVLWPAVMLIVPQEKLGKAFGLLSLIQSIGLTGFNFLIGWANDVSGASAANPGGYAPGMWLFSLTTLAAVIFALLLYRHEKGPGGHGLESPGGRKAPIRA
ncbi:MAG TPA: MFS transporter [Holophaga sp.]|nr:MFS transporter [Holophaga sp.]